MLPVTLINSLQALARSATPLIVADNTPPPAGKAALAAATQEPPLAAGQQVQATIQEQLSPGLFKVLIAGQTVQMQLPAQLKVGNVITLKVESVSPRQSGRSASGQNTHRVLIRPSRLADSGHPPGQQTAGCRIARCTGKQRPVL
jgi:hypothetical protein